MGPLGHCLPISSPPNIVNTRWFAFSLVSCNRGSQSFLSKRRSFSYSVISEHFVHLKACSRYYSSLPIVSTFGHFNPGHNTPWYFSRKHFILKNAVFWNVTPCSSCMNRRLEGLYRLRHQDEKNRRVSNI
jgi:hypothetical protein